MGMKNEGNGDFDDYPEEYGLGGYPGDDSDLEWFWFRMWIFFKFMNKSNTGKSIENKRSSWNWQDGQKRPFFWSNNKHIANIDES